MTTEPTSDLFVQSRTYKPFRYPAAVMLAKQHAQIHWVEESADLIDDVSDWKRGLVTPPQKHFITQVLRLFTQSDVNVGRNYFHHLIPRFHNNEVVLMLGEFGTREGLHQRAYALLVDTLGFPDSEYHAFLEYAAMADKHEHMLDIEVSTDTGLMLALAKGVFNEGVSLFASFAMLLTFQRQGRMKGMGQIVQWSQDDETIHVLGLAYLFKTMADEMPHVVTDGLKLAIYDMARKTVELEDRFVDLAFELGGTGDLTPEAVKQYVRFVTDRRLTQLGLKENWGIVDNPLPWIDWIMGGEDHTNFFEGKSAQYEEGTLAGDDWGYSISTEGVVTQGWRVITKPDCPWCDMAKELLTPFAANTVYVELTDAEERARFYKTNGFDGLHGPRGAVMPKIYEIVSGCAILVGGAVDLRRLLKSRQGSRV